MSHWFVFISFLMVVGGAYTRIAPFHVEEEDAFLTVPQLIRKNGFPVEEHQVRTDDNYLLSLYRIPARNNTRKHPVFMMHSFPNTCADWVLLGRKHGLAFLLADQDFDIWMGNARGNRYSRKHDHLPLSSPEFWNFTFHEIGVYDVPASIDYVLEQTNAEKLHYIGYSQGAMTGIIALSTRPEYNAKVVELQALSPAVYLHRSRSALIRFITPIAKPLGNAFRNAGRYEMAQRFDQQYLLFRLLCSAPTLTLCRRLLYDVVGANPKQLDSRMLRIHLGHVPSGASVKQLQHYAQLVNDGIFRQFDYGEPQKNLDVYGNLEVPRYNLSQVTVPVRIYFGYNDHMVNFLNVLQLEKELPNVISSYLVPDKRFNHLDFILGNYVKEMLYEEIVKNVEKSEFYLNDSLRAERRNYIIKKI